MHVEQPTLIAPYTPTVPAPSYTQFEVAVATWWAWKVSQLGGHVFSNVYIKDDDKTTELDLVVLLPDQLIVVECKDYSGIVYCAHDSGPRWTEITSNGKYSFYSPVYQNLYHCRMLCKCLFLHPSQVQSLVVFADTATLYELPPETPTSKVVTFSQLKAMSLCIDSKSVFNQDAFNAIQSSLSVWSRSDHVIASVHDSQFDANSIEKSCPLCGHPLRVRQGRTKFLGCSMYPQCTYTERIH